MTALAEQTADAYDGVGARRHLVPHFTSARAWAHPDVPVLVRGEGAWVTDDRGRQWLDGLSGLFSVNLGHGRRDLAQAGARQLEALAFVPTWGYAHQPGIEAATLIAALAPGDLDRIFFVNSGAEAVESAIKLARSCHVARGEPLRHKVIVRDWAYHGVTLGALSLTQVPKLRAAYGPLLTDTAIPVANTRGLDAATAAAAVEQAIIAAGPETVSMVIAEPVQNAGGALVPPDGYWPELRRICDAHGVLLCADEVITGFGRTGRWFGSERYGVVPDLLTFAKGVTSSYVPLGGVIARSPVLQAIEESPGATFVHGSTFGSHPVATAVAVANITAMREEGVLANVRAHEAGLRDRLDALARAHPSVAEVRGTGFLYAVELGPDRAPAIDVLNGLLREARLLARADDRGGTMLVLAPMLVSDDAVLDELARRVDQVLDRTDALPAHRP